jgi:hypothetical protein
MTDVSEKLCAEDWLKKPQYEGITVLDADGWDRKNYAASWAELIDENEFEVRLTSSTCSWKGPIGARVPSCL